MPTTVVGGAKKTKKDMTCGVNPKTDRCKKGEPKGKDMCVLNKSTNRCKKDQHTEAKNYARIFKGGAATTTRTARATSPVKGGARATSPVKGGARATSPVRGGKSANSSVKDGNYRNFRNCMIQNHRPVRREHMTTRNDARKSYLARLMHFQRNKCILNHHPSDRFRCATKKELSCSHHRDRRSRYNCQNRVSC